MQTIIKKSRYGDSVSTPHRLCGHLLLTLYLAHRNRSDLCDLRLRCPSRTPEIAAISETRASNAALRFKGCDGKSLAICDFGLRCLSPKPLLSAGSLAILAPSLDGRNRAIVITESLARVTAAIRSTSVRWRSYLTPKTQKLVLTDPVFVVPRFGSRDWRSLVEHSFLQNGLRELIAFAER